MSFIELTKSRYSLRKFADREVEEEKLLAILEAGRAAPTAVNCQPQRILVVRGDEALAKLSECTKCVYGARTALVVCYDKTAARESVLCRRNLGDTDAAIVTTQMMYAAEELGLGTLWVCAFDLDKLVEQFEIPEYLAPMSILMVGYPAENAFPSRSLHFSRRPLEETVFFDSFEEIEPFDKEKL